MVSKASEDLPEPDRPVKTTSRSRGISTSMFLRLCSRAPRIAITRWPALRGSPLRGSLWRLARDWSNRSFMGSRVPGFGGCDDPEGAPPTCCEHRKNGRCPPAQSYDGSRPGDNGWAREGQSGGSACRPGGVMLEQKENKRTAKNVRGPGPVDKAIPGNQV